MMDTNVKNYRTYCFKNLKLLQLMISLTYIILCTMYYSIIQYDKHTDINVTDILQELSGYEMLYKSTAKISNLYSWFSMKNKN